MSYIRLSRANYWHNLNFLSEKLGSANKLAVVLKDNAYGHGLLEMASLACEFGINRAIVRSHEEAFKIEPFFNNIIILLPNVNYPYNPKFSLVVNSLDSLYSFDSMSALHLKVDTGMHRNGIMMHELDKALNIVKKQNLNLEAVMTHFRSGDELSGELFWQMKNWREIKQRVSMLFSKKILFHSANSATLLRLKNYEDDFARCGIASFGYHHMPLSFGKFNLKPVMTLYANKISTRFIKKGERVGYGGIFHSTKDMKISSYDIGYGDGFFRFDGVGKFSIADGRNILGRISMDSFMIEGEDDEVVVFDNVQDIASLFETISYDILVKLSSSIKRVVI